MGNFLSNTLHGIEHAVQGAGHGLGSVLKTAAPFATLIPGVGPGLAAAGEGLGELMAPGGNLKRAIMGGGMTYLGSRMGGASGGMVNNLPSSPSSSTDDGYGGVAGDSASTMGADDAAGGNSTLGNIYKAVNGVISVPRPDEPSQQPGAPQGGILNNIMGHLTNGNGGLSNPLLLGLAGAEGVMGAKAYSRMGTLQDKALASVENAYNQRAPLRTQGLSMMQNTLAHPVSAQATFADPGNPYSRPPIPLPTSQPQANPQATPPIPAAA